MFLSVDESLSYRSAPCTSEFETRVLYTSTRDWVLKIYVNMVISRYNGVLPESICKKFNIWLNSEQLRDDLGDFSPLMQFNYCALLALSSLSHAFSRQIPVHIRFATNIGLLFA